MLTVARARITRFTNLDAVAGARRLITDFVRAADCDAALVVLNQQPTSGALGNWKLDQTTTGLGVYAVTAPAAWCVGNPLISPSKQSSRQMILRQLHDMEATAHGAPEAEPLE
ncbi:hypothetical protein [Nocardia farcinica]|uniref:hypothetical protein n=1 Tax=Nocardia farcinica TaxID=37329 RepID=UPI000BF28BD7|nr:hypothetical protein [Nocardia farcinica]MBF6363882.1 hypothetical protein [Nocardia farcinica]MBF6445296.1 hypothetical protein [Nocardia farcinica]MBF6522655.1 hypothetical protein [Nocardia farcinica]PFW98615.1 hypothetical protein CJ469_06074 [Nocardia farcinica]PFX03232.1 hypothetical protein CJ468_05691 [Nocardia farcinica]